MAAAPGAGQGVLGLDRPGRQPVVPFQIMGDIWRAGLPDRRRRKTAWLAALWWTCWLLSGVGPAQSAANQLL